MNQYMSLSQYFCALILLLKRLAPQTTDLRGQIAGASAPFYMLIYFREVLTKLQNIIGIKAPYPEHVLYQSFTANSPLQYIRP